MYEPRTYRRWVTDTALTAFTVIIEETDLYVRATRSLETETRQLVISYRKILEDYIKKNPSFRTSLTPITVDKDSHPLIQSMADAAQKTGVGPMAAVAGALAEYVGRDLLHYSPEVIVENGGDIFIKSLVPRTIGIYAGTSPFSATTGIEIEPQQTPLGICTSSGTVGHSLSFGCADAVIVLASSTILADAAATAIGNIVTDDGPVEKAIDFAREIDGLSGIVVIRGDKLGVWGNIKLCKTE